MHSSILLSAGVVVFFKPKPFLELMTLLPEWTTKNGTILSFVIPGVFVLQGCRLSRLHGFVLELSLVVALFYLIAV
jgi:hypothetical protein